MKKGMIMKMVSLMVLGVVAVGSMTGCSSGDTSTVEAIQKKEKIIMGTNATFPPFEEIQGTEVVGFDPEIAKLIAAELGVELEIVDMEFEQLLGAVDSGKIDFIAAGMTATAERATQVDFSDAYFLSNQAIIVKADEDGITTAEDLVDKEVGVQLGTTGDLFVSGTDGITVVRYDKGAMAVADVASGQIDAVIIDEEAAKLIANNQDGVKVLEAPFIEESYAIAVSKGNESLLQTINEVLANIQADGTYDALYTQFFGEIE